jgi:predicted TIM-barrel fold metal-dependent hydrolase
MDAHQEMRPAMPSRPTASELVHQELDHPVIDADAHYIEFFPAMASYLHDEGLEIEEVFKSEMSLGAGALQAQGMPIEERARKRATRSPWWVLPAGNTLDFATANFPALLNERLDEFGIDFSVMYASAGLIYPQLKDDAIRVSACRAGNRYAADAFRDFSQRMTPAATIPMNTPEEAIEMLEFATGELGYKAAVIASYVERPVEEVAGGAHNVWWDTFGIDSLYDYDPFWRRCVELGVSITSHSGTMGVGFRRSISNYMYNHIGHFGAAGEALAKSLFFGGVTRRFPGLRVGMLEGGVHWGVGLYADLIARWEKRNAEAVMNYDPTNLDQQLFAELLQKYGTGLLERMNELPEGMAVQEGPFDDFSALGIEKPEDVRDLFVSNFYFGCEADDPMTATAFDVDRIPLGTPLRAMFSSDIGHWDVPDMTQVLKEAYENVDKGWLDRDQFRDFTFGNVARFYTDTNPAFFEGTAVEAEVAAAISSR